LTEGKRNRIRFGSGAVNGLAVHPRPLGEGVGKVEPDSVDDAASTELFPVDGVLLARRITATCLLSVGLMG
jgi:hypothetical protein